MRFRAVLFDFGHTLFDVRDPGKLVSRCAAELGVRVAADEATQAWDAIGQVAARPEEIARERDLSRQAHRANWVRLLSPLDRFAAGLAEVVYDAHIAPDHWAPYSDTLQTLRALAASGLSVAIVSDCGFDLRPIFALHLGGEPLVQEFVLSFEHGRVKPAPELFRAALQGLGVEASEAVMVGDNQVTDGGASAVGIASLILPRTPRGEPRGLDAVLRLVAPSAGEQAAS